MEPSIIQNNLALYSIGKGPAVFLMPYPHASSARSTADGRFAELIVESGFRVITFDPPSFARSSRSAASDLNEMISCTMECLDFFNIKHSIPFIGHSMGGFCAIALCIEHPHVVSSLLISGSPSGWGDVRKYSIHKKWKWWEGKFWLSRYLGGRIILNLANLKIHKDLDNLFNYECFHDKNYYEKIAISFSDSFKPTPPRAIWLRNLQGYEYSHRLGEIKIPVLIASGRYDPLVPTEISIKMKENTPGSEIIIFKNSGHSPFIEERDKFGEMLKGYLHPS